MRCHAFSSNPSFLYKTPNNTPPKLLVPTLSYSSNPTPDPISPITGPSPNQIDNSNPISYSVEFKTLGGCKLGISRYPDFTYNAEGGFGSGSGVVGSNREICVGFDVKRVRIPPLSGSTTKFLGLSLPPLLKIDVVPEVLQGSIDKESGKVELEFKAKFWFSIGTIYRAPPLLVATLLTSEESKGNIRGSYGQRLDRDDTCRLVGVAIVDPIDDQFMNAFLGLPTECLAILNASILLSPAEK